MAQELDHTVLLVDADLRAPAIHKYFGLPAGPGLIDYLEGSKSIPELLVHPQGLDKLVLLSGGRPTDSGRGIHPLRAHGETVRGCEKLLPGPLHPL